MATIQNPRPSRALTAKEQEIQARIRVVEDEIRATMQPALEAMAKARARAAVLHDDLARLHAAMKVAGMGEAERAALRLALGPTPGPAAVHGTGG